MTAEPRFLLIRFDPVQEIAAEPATLAAFGEMLRRAYPPATPDPFQPLGPLAGIPLINDPLLLPGVIYLRPHPASHRTGDRLPMALTTDNRTLTQAQLVAEATERFGPEPLNWAFRCPACGDIANGHDFRQALADNPRKHRDGSDAIASDLVGRECIGRTLGALNKSQGEWTGRGCDWAAYGLLAGPWTVELPDGRTMHAFPLADPAAPDLRVREFPKTPA